MLLKWVETKDVDEFAASVVAELARRFPSSGVDPNARKATERIYKTHRAVFDRVEAFARSADLNLYRKARLGNRVKWALAEAGYTKFFVEAFTHELLTVVTLAAAGPRPRVEK